MKKEYKRMEFTILVLDMWLNEVSEQPEWRAQADREMDYCDGNQLDSVVLARQAEIGIPPAIENVMGPTFDYILGEEAKNRTDANVIPNGVSSPSANKVAKALSYKLNNAEKKSKADRACSAAYEGLMKVGIGWVEVVRESNPFKYPYRCRPIHRNEIFFDFLAKEPDLSDSRFLIRKKWTGVDEAVGMFPEKEELLRTLGKGLHPMLTDSLVTDGGASTGLGQSRAIPRGWSVEEQEWRSMDEKRICLLECWYRSREEVVFIRLGDGRVIEIDENDPFKNQEVVDAIFSGVEPERGMVDKMRLSFWVGPYKMADMPSPYKHQRFPYVPFFGKREDRTRAPFGLARNMMYLQDEINARISKMQWGLGAVMIKMTEGVLAMEVKKFLAEIGRPDAVVVLNPEAMKDGGIFEVDNNFEMNAEQAGRLREAKESVKNNGPVSDAFKGDVGGTPSNVSLNTQIERSVTGIADMKDNFQDARTTVLELLLDMIIEDSAGKQEEITLKGGAIKGDELVILNQRMYEDDTGTEYIDNSTEQILLDVVLAEVPSTQSYKTQQFASMSESFKSAPQYLQDILAPYLIELTDLEYRDEIIEQMKEKMASMTPEQIDAKVKEEVEKALAKAGIDLKQQEIDLKRQKQESDEKKMLEEIRNIVADTVVKKITAIYSGTQAATEILSIPGVAPVADQVLDSAGFEDEDEAPIVGAFLPGVESGARLNTSPAFPPVARSSVLPEATQEGMIEPELAAAGINDGIEKQEAPLF